MQSKLKFSLMIRSNIHFSFSCIYVANGVFDKYDSMAYPRIGTKTRIVKVIDWISFNTGFNENEGLIPDHNSMQAGALRIYLSTYETVLCECKLSQLINVKDATEKICKIFHALQESQIHVADLWQGKMPWKCSSLSKVRLVHAYIVSLGHH